MLWLRSELGSLHLQREASTADSQNWINALRFNLEHYYNYVESLGLRKLVVQISSGCLCYDVLQFLDFSQTGMI